MRCSICKNPFLRATVDRLLDEKMTYAGISRYAGDAGVAVEPTVISRHADHYRPPEERPSGTRKHDFAVMIRDKAAQQLDSGELDLSDKDSVPGINAGLKAQALIDKREAGAKKQTQSEMLVALLAALRGEGSPAALPSPVAIDGEYKDVTPANTLTET